MDIEKLLARAMRGESVEELHKELQEGFMNYVHLLTTLTDEQISKEIGSKFGEYPHQAAIICFLFAKLRILENEHRQCN